ncbi:MAG: hypothetical protein ACJAU0_000894 [Flavobacteriales bacterium]
MSKKPIACLNCSTSLKAEFEYCPSCGQETLNTTASVGEFFKHFLSDYFTFDSKILRSFGPLFFKPGFLTNEFLAGKRVHYISPLRMYIFISLAFFLVLSLLGDSSIELQSEQELWNNFFGSYLPKVFFVLLPIFAFLLWLLYIRQKTTFIRHFVFSLHFHSFLFVVTLFYLLLSELLSKFGLIGINQVVSICLGLSFFVYLFFGLRRSYHQGYWKTFLKFTLLVLAYNSIVFVIIGFTLLFASQV